MNGISAWKSGCCMPRDRKCMLLDTHTKEAKMIYASFKWNILQKNGISSILWRKKYCSKYTRNFCKISPLKNSNSTSFAESFQLMMFICIFVRQSLERCDLLGWNFQQIMRIDPVFSMNQTWTAHYAKKNCKKNRTKFNSTTFMFKWTFCWALLYKGWPTAQLMRARQNWELWLDQKCQKNISEFFLLYSGPICSDVCHKWNSVTQCILRASLRALNKRAIKWPSLASAAWWLCHVYCCLYVAVCFLLQRLASNSSNSPSWMLCGVQRERAFLAFSNAFRVSTMEDRKATQGVRGESNYSLLKDYHG